ncbi:MAG: amidohydrolase family protein [Bacteroidia bacterium]|nr:amidohydrolase family protein [Bacteroidia bacterium]
MMSRCTYFLLLLIFFSCTTQPKEEIHLLHDVQIIDPEEGEVQRFEQMALKDGRIHYVGERKDWDSYKIIGEDSLPGKYLLPPLWDMHSHLAWDAANDSLLFPFLFFHGILGLRDMGGDLGILKSFKEKVAKNPSFGPQIFGAGPILDGNPPIMMDVSLPLDEDADFPYILDSLKNGGADFFKVYSLLKEDALREISSFSDQSQLSFQGHLSEYVDPEISISLGQKSVEHLNRLEEIAANDQERFEEIGELMAKEESWLCPTLVIYQKKAFMDDPGLENEVYHDFIPPVLKAEWEGSKKRRLKDKSPEDWAAAKALFEEQKAWVYQLHKMGVKLLAGSDFAGMPYVYPGLGLWEELDLLKEIGLSDKEVLKIACQHPIEFLGLQEEYGKLEVGKKADFLLLSENPLKDIQNIRNIDMVYRDGNRMSSLFHTFP